MMPAVSGVAYIGDVELAQDIGQGADVVLVSVGYDYASDAVFVLLQVA